MLDQIVEDLMRMNQDELLVVKYVCSGVLGKGRQKYGPLDLAADQRDFARETAEEVRDSFFYIGSRVIAESIRKERG